MEVIVLRHHGGRGGGRENFRMNHGDFPWEGTSSLCYSIEGRTPVQHQLKGILGGGLGNLGLVGENGNLGGGLGNLALETISRPAGGGGVWLGDWLDDWLGDRQHLWRAALHKGVPMQNR